MHAASVRMEEGGMDALVTLGCGDMRRSLNILQVLPQELRCSLMAEADSGA